MTTTQTEPSRTRTKNPIGEVQEVVAQWRARNKKALPAEVMPPDDRGAAAWWVEKMQEPADPVSDNPREVPVVGRRDATRMVFPYIDRVCETMNAFLNMPLWKQRMVVAAREDGFWWRGEVEDVVGPDGNKVWVYALVLEQYELQQKMGKEAYREYAVAKYRAAKAAVKSQEAKPALEHANAALPDVDTEGMEPAEDEELEEWQPPG